ncbi:MAG: CHAT domain-containing protein [Bacteroidota bacterium]
MSPFAQVNHYLDHQQFDQALAELQTIDPTTLSPSNRGEWHFLYATIHNMLEEYDEAISAFLTAQNILPNRGDILYGLGVACLEAGQPADAVTNLQLALPLLTTPLLRSVTFSMLADALRDTGDWRGQLKNLSLAVTEATVGNLPPEQQLDALVELTRAQHTYEEYAALEKTSTDARAIADAAGLPEYSAFFLSELASAAAGLGNLSAAESYNHKLLAISQETGDTDGICTAYNNLGLNALATGDPENGINFLRQAIDLETDPLQRSIETANLSRCYEQTGDWAQATALILDALTTVKDLEEDEKIISYSLRAADLYFRIEDYPRAREYCQQCIAAFDNFPRTNLYVHALINIGLTHYRQDDYAEAEQIFAKADEEASRQNADDFTWAILCEAIAGMHQRRGRFLLAREYYERSRNYASDDQDETAPFNLGTLHHLAEDYPAAKYELARAATLIENQRQNLTGLARRTFDQQKAGIYEYRAEVFARTDQLTAALWQLELLKERTDGTEPPLSHPQHWLAEIRASLSPNEVVIYYANTHHNVIPVFLLTKEVLRVTFLPVGELMTLTEPFADAITRHYYTTQDTLDKGQSYSRTAVPYPSVFEAAILYYRDRLTQSPQLQASKIARTRSLASALYHFLLKPFYPEIKSANHLTIIPDRSLYLLPFSTLVDDQNRYLAETTTLRIAPSLSALQRMRTADQSARTGDPISISVSNYEATPSTNRKGSLKTVEEIPGLRVAARQSIAQGDSLEWAYQQIGVSRWTNLKGVTNETTALAIAFPDLHSLTENEVTVEALLAPKQQTHLQQASHIHFAGHGITFPGIPELNALILHPSGQRQYLHQQLIEGLPLYGAIVNLSACETALGAINGAGTIDGVLTAFLRAGASGVCASLWSVFDDEHARLVTNIYQRLATGIPFPEAIAQTQRACISGELGSGLRWPVYWASLVYCG